MAGSWPQGRPVASSRTTDSLVWSARNVDNDAMRRTVLLAVLAVALTAAGGASAYALRTVFLKPGHCTKVHGTKVCARDVKPKLVTVTVAPSPVGQSSAGTETRPLRP